MIPNTYYKRSAVLESVRPVTYKSSSYENRNAKIAKQLVLQRIGHNEQYSENRKYEKHNNESVKKFATTNFKGRGAKTTNVTDAADNDSNYQATDAADNNPNDQAIDAVDNNSNDQATEAVDNNSNDQATDAVDNNSNNR